MLAYIRASWSTYPPIISTIAFIGLENVIISLTCGEARLLPIIIKTANEMQAYINIVDKGIYLVLSTYIYLSVSICLYLIKLILWYYQ